MTNLSKDYSYYKNKTLNNFKDNKNIIKSIKDFLINDKGIYLYGGVGTGKTHLAIATYKLIENNKQFTTVSNVLLEIRENFNYGTEWDILKEYVNCEYLFLDDFGTEKITDFTVEMIYILIDKRYCQGNDKIFITSNLSLKQISNLFCDRIASRIAEMCEIIKLADKDHRIK